VKSAADRAGEAIEAAEKTFAEEMGATLDLSPAAKMALIVKIAAAIEAAITGRTDDPSAVRSNQRVDGAAQLAEGSMRASLILAHKPAETGHIGMQDGGKLPFLRRSFSRKTRRVIEQGAHR